MTKDKLDTELETKEGEPVLKFTNLWNFLIFPPLASGRRVNGTEKSVYIF